MAAQTRTLDFRHTGVPQNDPNKPFTEIYRDTIDRSYSTTEIRDSVLDPLRVVTNKFGNNWFVFGTAGAHTFQGDYSSTSKFSGTISTDWSLGLGKWFTPGLALKLEFIRSKSQGYTQYLTGHYGTGPIQLNDQNIPFRNMETSWWDISGSVILNFTRLFYGYEGYNSPKRMNQIMGAFGFGGVHHLGYEHSHGSDNEWAGHIEVQYSRFFTKSKRFSLDLKLRGIFYQTNFDLEYGAYDGASNKWDSNLGVDLGFTYYLGKKRGNSWSQAMTQVYRRDFRQQDVLVYRERVDTVMGKQTGTMKTLTFYVFYPNNYSGRNDAPIVSNANVNAIDYLLGGIFTQKKYNDAATVAAMLSSGARTTQQPYSDIPTEPAYNDFTIDCVQRGYEMSQTTPLSLSMMPSDMDNFYNQAGYFYAPIWDGLHEWHYRIDDATLKQQLVSSANYYEKETYGLNAHSGIPTLLEHMETDQGDCLVSFADVYAALNGNKGFVANYTNPETVEMIRDVFRNGIITVIEAHGVATSQDNYSGDNAHKVGLERNKSLADSRAKTVVKWLKGTDVFNDTKSIVYIDNGFTSAINKVSDPSTRGLNAKLNRCVKVRIQVIY
ncbi:MAG: hypothetical protein K2K37_12100 [Muribaculaceae bacterium]|nr:hypothetical protein [Muribaculaceae bacterium]